VGEYCNFLSVSKGEGKTRNFATCLPESSLNIRRVTLESITDQQVLEWIAADKAKTPAAQQEFIKYASLHTLHNADLTRERLLFGRNHVA